MVGKKNKVYCSECIHAMNKGHTSYCEVDPNISVDDDFWKRTEHKIYAKCAVRNKNNNCKRFEILDGPPEGPEPGV